MTASFTWWIWKLDICLFFQRGAHFFAVHLMHDRRRWELQLWFHPRDWEVSFRRRALNWTLMLGPLVLFAREVLRDA